MIKSMILAAALAFCMPAMATAAGPPEQIADAVFTERIGEPTAAIVDFDVVLASEAVSASGPLEGFGAVTDYDPTDPFTSLPGREVPAPEMGSLT